jgi:hypothetical protein
MEYSIVRIFVIPLFTKFMNVVLRSEFAVPTVVEKETYAPSVDTWLTPAL